MTNFTMKDKYRLFLYISEGFESNHLLEEELQKIIDPNFNEEHPYFALCPIGGDQSNHYATWYANSSMVELGVPNQGLSDVLELGHMRLKDATMVYIFSNGQDPKADTLEARCKEQSIPYKVVTYYNSRHLRVPYTFAVNPRGSFGSSLGYKVEVDGRDYFVRIAEEGYDEPVITDAHSGYLIPYTMMWERNPDEDTAIKYEKYAIACKQVDRLNDVAVSEAEYAQVFANIRVRCLLENKPDVVALLNSKPQVPATVTV